jgi:histone H3/H4
MDTDEEITIEQEIIFLDDDKYIPELENIFSFNVAKPELKHCTNKINLTNNSLIKLAKKAGIQTMTPETTLLLQRYIKSKLVHLLEKSVIVKDDANRRTLNRSDVLQAFRIMDMQDTFL